MKGLLCREDGSIAIELAFMLPIFFLVMWFGAEAAYHFRIETRLHRATATLAEILANVNVGKEAGVATAIRAGVDEAKDMLEDMMGSENPGKVGIQVDFLDSPLVSVAPEDLDASRIISFSAKRGVNCRRTSSVKNLTAMIWPAGDLTTEANASKAMLVRVEGCYRPDERPSMVDLLFPKEYYSNFVVLRKK